jgi:hypothetical protein
MESMWYMLERQAFHYGDEGKYHFCRLECLVAWGAYQVAGELARNLNPENQKRVQVLAEVAGILYPAWPGSRPSHPDSEGSPETAGT